MHPPKREVTLYVLLQKSIQDELLGEKSKVQGETGFPKDSMCLVYMWDTHACICTEGKVRDYQQWASLDSGLGK